jgi:8-amino-7-oxononanoate synthase
MTVCKRVRIYLKQLDKRGLLRNRVVSNPLDPNTIRFDSNDYLSLLGDVRISEAYTKGHTDYPSGSGASMLLSGYHANHKAVECAFTKFLKVDECLLFSSGYAANLAVTTLLGVIKVHAIIDKGIHASMYDGLSLSRGLFTRFLHNNIEHLAKQLSLYPEHSVVITEGIFSMNGQVAPLAAISRLCMPKKIPLIVDEAHSFGVIGPQGAGAVAMHQLTQYEVPLRIIPLGKAFAAQGAIVAGQSDWIQALLQAARSLIYSTAVSPALSFGLLKTLDFVIEANDRRDKLEELIKFFKEKILTSPLKWADSNTAIQQIHLGCPFQALHYAQELKRNGISCSAVRAPTVTPKNTGLRIVLNYQHSAEQITFLFKILHEIYEYTFD